MEMSKTVGFQSLAAVIVIGILFGLPATGYAEDAAIVETVTDSTGGRPAGRVDHGRARSVGQHV